MFNLNIFFLEGFKKFTKGIQSNFQEFFDIFKANTNENLKFLVNDLN